MGKELDFIRKRWSLCRGLWKVKKSTVRWPRCSGILLRPSSWPSISGQNFGWKRRVRFMKAAEAVKSCTSTMTSSWSLKKICCVRLWKSLRQLAMKTMRFVLLLACRSHFIIGPSYSFRLASSRMRSRRGSMPRIPTIWSRWKIVWFRTRWRRLLSIRWLGFWASTGCPSMMRERLLEYVPSWFAEPEKRVRCRWFLWQGAS